VINSKQKVRDLCDQVVNVNPSQIIIDMVQDEIEELVESKETTPDEIGAQVYKARCLIDVYNPSFKNDIWYLSELISWLEAWNNDATFANKLLGLDPNQ